MDDMQSSGYVFQVKTKTPELILSPLFCVVCVCVLCVCDFYISTLPPFLPSKRFKINFFSHWIFCRKKKLKDGNYRSCTNDGLADCRGLEKMKMGLLCWVKSVV